MTEYLYNAVLATSGNDVEITAKVKDKEGTPIIEGCSLKLYQEDNAIQDIVGTYKAEEQTWYFTIPNADYKGRYFYTIEFSNEPISFKEPIYFK